MSGLKQLLLDLGRDAALAEAYERDAEAVMERYGLEDEEKQALRERDQDRLRELSGLGTLEAPQTGPIQGYE